jgi:hypothetical protein
MPDLRHKLRNVGPVFTTNRETKMLSCEIALKQGWAKCYRAIAQRGWTTMHTVGRHWLEYDWVTIAILLFGMGMLELLVFSM